jgi:phage tail sheath protein FI
MSEYLSPGVYVEEIPSAVKPIAGVSTSTACFLGIVPIEITIPGENPNYDPTGRAQPDPKKPEEDPNKPFLEKKFKFFTPDEIKAKVTAAANAKAALDANKDATKRKDLLKALTDAENEEEQAKFPAKDLDPVLCTNFSEFKKHFGDFSTDGLGASSKDVNTFAGDKGLQNRLAHAVFGFFDNGGTRCYVMRFRTGADMLQADHLDVLEPIEEISIIAAPGITDPTVQKNLVDHCTKLKSRFAILDPPELDESADLTVDTIQVVGNSDYAALYFPRIRVFDIASDLTRPERDDTSKAHEVNNGKIWIGPSGHMAGIYSQVDHERGVHKAPANVVMRDALDVEFDISRNRQDGLNPQGTNCIRLMNKNITVWGARTIGGDANTDLKYINVRRTLIFLRESIDHGTQWVVFEPNDRTLWAKIRLNVTAFLTTVWRDGALFGSTPQEAFYVKCDDETNPREEREVGRVTCEIGVAIVRPAEFVIFRISQWAGPEQK